MTELADILIVQASVITADPDLPTCESVAIRDKRILFVGDGDRAQEFLGPQTRIIDAQGRTLMPGIIDCHFHLKLGSMELATIRLGDVKTLADFSARLQAYASVHPQKEWLEGNGLLYSLQLPDRQTLNRHHLDSMIADRPLGVIAYDGHTAWANTLALEKAGILRGGSTPPGSQIVIGDDGLATGELREPDAFAYVFDLIPKPDKDELRNLVRQGLALAAQHGITSVHNMDGDYEQAEMYREMEQAGEMSLRVYVPFTTHPGMPLEALEEASAMQRDFQGEMVRAGSAKFFMDGVLESYTALLTEDYATRPGYLGEAQFELEEFIRLAGECDRLGLQIFVHACGDGAVRRALDGYQTIQTTNPPHPRRHRIEHIEVIHPDDLPRFARLGVIASMQPLHSPLDVSIDPDPWPLRVGEGRYHRSFAWSYLRQAGARLVFGSDWPVVSLDPILGFHAAFNRKPWGDNLPDHRQTLDEALASYTREAAFAEFREDQKGQIKPGMLADLVLLSANLKQQTLDAISEVHPELTLCGGKIVYQAE